MITPETCKALDKSTESMQTSQNLRTTLRGHECCFIDEQIKSIHIFYLKKTDSMSVRSRWLALLIYYKMLKIRRCHIKNFFCCV